MSLDHINIKKIRKSFGKIPLVTSLPNLVEVQKILELRPRIEKIAIKDVKLRTFITEDNSRNELVNHVYENRF